MKVFENKKMLLGILTMIVVLMIIVVSSFFPFIFDPSRIGTNEFITDQLVIMAITISATISMMFIAQSNNASNPNSELAQAKKDFVASLKNITNHSVFYQWIKKVLQPRDRKDIAQKKMQNLGVPFELFLLNPAEIRSLINPTKIGDKFYKALTKKQINEILALQKYVRNIKFVSPSYYTTMKNWMVDKNLSEIASNENKKKVLTILFELGLKIIMSFIIASILASLVRDLAQEGGNTAQAWMRFLSRLFAYISSSFLGYTLGVKINDLDGFYISKRVEAHTLFFEDKTFVYVDEAQEEYEKFYGKEEITNEQKDISG